MNRVWLPLMLTALLCGQSTPAFAQLTVVEKSAVSLPTSVGAGVFSPDGQTLAGIDGPRVVLLDVATGKEIAALHGQSGGITCLAFAANGASVATGNEDATIKVWDLKTKKQSAVLRSFSDQGRSYPRSLSFSPDGNDLATMSWFQDPPGSTRRPERFVRIWDVRTGKERANLVTKATGTGLLSSLSYSPDGKMLLLTTPEAIPVYMPKAAVTCWWLQ